MKNIFMILICTLMVSSNAYGREKWKEVLIVGATITAAAAIIAATSENHENNPPVAYNPNVPVSIPGTGRPDPRCPASMPYYSPDWGCLTMPR